MHDPIAKTGAWVEQMLNGHLNYYAVSPELRQTCRIEAHSS
jgi:hypothetical protein